MRRYHFRLESARRWREIRLELEEEKLGELFAELRKADSQIAAVAEQVRVAEEFLQKKTLEGHELASLDTFRRRAADETQRLRQARAAVEQRIQAQQARVAVAERDLQLLEKLKQRTFAEWERELAREEDAFAAEADLARRARRDHLLGHR